MPRTQRAHTKTRAVTQRVTPAEAILLALVLCALVYAAVTGDYSGTAPTDLSTKTIRVRQADTLWGVAASHPVDGLDTAQTVSLIQEINDMSDSALAAGQILLVPADTRAATAMASRD